MHGFAAALAVLHLVYPYYQVLYLLLVLCAQLLQLAAPLLQSRVLPLQLLVPRPDSSQFLHGLVLVDCFY